MNRPECRRRTLEDTPRWMAPTSTDRRCPSAGRTARLSVASAALLRRPGRVSPRLRATYPIGPADVTVSAAFAAHGETALLFPPLGRVSAHTHSLPVSLEVMPAAGLPLQTMDSGGRLAIVNHGRTPLDYRAAVRIDAPAGETLSAVAAELAG